ncbi:MAG: shikimate dehydrogenase [Candidatus Sericytochromatia bacterium]|nr:shikimate dehydrogenase [Candidatus Tanganyikabacteria bacterium]
MMPGAGTRLYGVIGFPLGHTLSPALHNAAFAATGHDGVYVALPVAPARLADAMAGVRALRIAGLSVTVPHKVAVVDLLDGLTPEARAAGAVNAVYREGERLLGHNTDIAGYQAMLAEAGQEARRALVLGAGGAARAVCLALRRAGIPFTVAARDTAKAADLARALGAGGDGSVRAAIAWEDLGTLLPAIDLLINTTPIGMHPAVAASPAPDLAALPAGAIVHDIVYRPRETLLLAAARARGLRTVEGGTMLVAQAAEAFERWTGFPAPVAEMRAAFEQATGDDQSC